MKLIGGRRTRRPPPPPRDAIAFWVWFWGEWFGTSVSASASVLMWV